MEWGPVGQPVLAIGCVAARAMGQVAVGIAGIGAGAASGAALRFMQP